MAGGTLTLPGAQLAYKDDATGGSLALRGPNGELTAQHLLAVQSTPPTALAGSGAGTSPPAPVVTSGSNDARGNVTGGTGTSPAAGALIAVTFNQTYASPPTVNATPANAASAALLPYVTSVTTTGFTIATQGAPAAAQANTTYSFNYQVIG
jgi:hypothetical protein